MPLTWLPAEGRAVVHGAGQGAGLSTMQATTYSARAAAASFGRLTAGFQQAEYPAEVIEQTPEQRRARGFEQCLRDHGRDLDSGYPDRCAASSHCQWRTVAVLIGSLHWIRLRAFSVS